MKIIITGTKEFEQCDLYPKYSIHEVFTPHEDDSIVVDSRGRLSNKLKFEIWNDFISNSIKCPCGCNLKFSNDAIFLPTIEDGKVLIALRCWEKKYIPYRTEYRQALRTEIVAEIINSLKLE